MKLQESVLRRSLSLAALAGAIAVLAQAEVIERVIVRVNGDIVTQSEFEARQVAEIQSRRVSPSEIERFLRENNARILQDAVDELLLVQRAQELGYKIPPQYIAELIDGIKKENKIESDDELVNQLRREGMSLDDLKRNIERRILTEQVLRREIEPKLALTDAEARADYDKRRADYTRLPSVTLQEIVIPIDRPDAAPLAKELVHRARSGEDFGVLARGFSSGATKDSGGELGRVNSGDLTPEVEKVAFALPAGGVSDPIPSATAYRILKVTEKSEGSLVPFEEAKPEIMRRLTQTLVASARESFLQGLRKSAIIDLRVREVPLQVSVPEGASLLEPPSLSGGGLSGAPPEAPGAPAPAAPTPASDEEITTTPQARPDRIAPPPAEPARPAPAPSPTPTPP